MILDKIVSKTKERVQTLIKNEKEILNNVGAFEKFVSFQDNGFYNAVSKEGISFICEIKKASPSKGLICENFDHIKIAQEYKQANADAISVLTEPYFFCGSNEYLTQVKRCVNLPVLRKDFIINELQIFEAKLLGADAVLLIVGILSEHELKMFIKLAEKLGLCALVEAHSKKEVEMALSCGAKVVGVNNRDLTTFAVDIRNSINLRRYVPKEIKFVSESGIFERNQIVELEENGVDAVLIGETLMKSFDIQKTLKELKGDM